MMVTAKTAKAAQLPAVMEWMFADSGLTSLGHKAAQLNPLRWTQGSPREVHETLSKLTGTEATRPLILRWTHRQEEQERQFEDAAAASTFLHFRLMHALRVAQITGAPSAAMAALAAHEEALLASGYQRPGTEYDDGTLLVGRRIWVDGYGPGLCYKFEKAMVGVSSHLVSLDETGTNVELKLERKGNGQLRWLLGPSAAVSGTPATGSRTSSDAHAVTGGLEEDIPHAFEPGPEPEPEVQHQSQPQHQALTAEVQVEAAATTLQLDQRAYLTYRKRQECVTTGVALIIFIVGCIAFGDLVSGAVASTMTVNGTVLEEAEEPNSGFAVWMMFKGGELALRAIALLSVVLLATHFLSKGIVQGIELCDQTIGRLDAQTQQKQLQKSQRQAEEAQAFSTTTWIRGILMVASGVFAWLPGKSIDVELDSSAQTSLWMLAVVSTSLLVWMGELLARLAKYRSHLKHLDAAAVSPVFAYSRNKGGSNEEEVFERNVPTIKSISELGFNGKRETCLLPKCCRRYKNHNCEEYVGDIFLVKEKYDMAKFLVKRMHDGAEPTTERMHSLRDDVQRLRTVLCRFGHLLIPGVVAGQWVVAVLEASVGVFLVMFSSVLALNNTQWVFDHHFENRNSRGYTVPAIGLGVICAACAVFCFLRPQLTKQERRQEQEQCQEERTRQRQEQGIEQLRDAVDETKPLRQRLTQVQIFGSLVILVAKLLYWVCKDNFSGVITSSGFDEELVLYFGALVVWWIICLLARSPLGEPKYQPKPQRVVEP